MSKSNAIVLSVVQQGLSSDEAARKFRVSKRWVNKLLVKYRSGGLAALKPLSKRPLTAPNKTSQSLEDQIVRLRLELKEQGFDAGPASIASRLNETWQSDFTHWRLEDGTDVEILNFLDDHSRFLLGCRAFIPVTGRHVVDLFLEIVAEFDAPQSTLTDNGRVFTARFGNGRNAFEYRLQDLGILQKNSSPNHPQTQGKIERFHQTLKLHLAQKPRATSVAMLQKQLNYFRGRYNNDRPHKALNGNIPAFAYLKTPKASTQDSSNFDGIRHRIDQVDSTGKVNLRRAGRMHHLGVGRATSESLSSF